MDAFRHNNIDQIKEILKNTDPNEKMMGYNEYTPLMVATDENSEAFF